MTILTKEEFKKELIKRLEKDKANAKKNGLDLGKFWKDLTKTNKK